jgi:hypothetical protein
MSFCPFCHESAASLQRWAGLICRNGATDNIEGMGTKKRTKTGTLLSDRILQFYKTLSPGFLMPDGISVMHPYQESEVWEVVASFYKKYYSDHQRRLVLFGINPGRFGAGVTGVPFTDPIRLEKECGIPNRFDKRFELSSEFIYEVINAWGGARAFYRHFFVSALSPLGFIRDGKNLNYYDDKVLQQSATPFILQCIRQQKEIFGFPETAFCLGEGTNYRYFCRINDQYGLFKDIIPLPHPRWVMQYRRRRKEEFIRMYVAKLGEAIDLIK